MKKIALTLFISAFAFAVFADKPEDLNKEGLAHFKKFEYKQAYESFSQAIALKADYAEAYYNRGMTWFLLPAGAVKGADGCDDLKKAQELGFKLKKDDLKKNGCE
jgi:tetratricopeptide (TPR) repeat protein